MVRYTRRRSFRRKAIAPRVPKEITWGQFATKAWSGVQQIRKLINVEEHRVDTSVATTIDNAGSVTHLTGVANGDTASTRTGSSILLKGLHMRFALISHASAATTVIRILVIKDKQQVADTTPTVTGVLNSADVVSHVVPDFTERFTILRDMTHTLDLVGSPIKTFDFKLPLTGTHVRYNGTATTDVQQNGIYLLLLSNQSTNVPTISSIHRLTFYDN